MAGRIVAQVEHLQREFAADDDEGASAGDPARVEGVVADEGECPSFAASSTAVDGDVDAGVVEADDLALDDDGVGDVDHVVKDVGEA